ncbi:hypothetical protein [Streptomyces sp. NPDC001401]|uniref:hypothetical protein n=1 Tax=Streptomyces sp. NPDC001401 TaxID=3364570 RepID=UPI00369C5D4A
MGRRAGAELLTRGLGVVSIAVTNVLAHNVTVIADRLGTQPTQPCATSNPP